MPNGKETALQERGLRRIESLEEITEAKTFFFDAVDAGNELIAYPVVARKGKLNLTHDLLNLYGVHWRYLVDVAAWDKIKRENGDTSLVMDDIIGGKKSQRHAAFAFSKKYLDAQKSLWLFVPNTPGWDYYEGVLIPRFQADYADYRTVKKKAHKVGDFIKS